MSFSLIMLQRSVLKFHFGSNSSNIEIFPFFFFFFFPNFVFLFFCNQVCKLCLFWNVSYFVQFVQPFHSQQTGSSLSSAPNPPAIRPRVRARRGQATDPHSIAERVIISFLWLQVVLHDFYTVQLLITFLCRILLDLRQKFFDSVIERNFWIGCSCAEKELQNE